MVLFSRDGKKGEGAVKEYRRYETEIMPTYITRVLKGDREEPEREKVEEQDKERRIHQVIVEQIIVEK